MLVSMEVDPAVEEVGMFERSGSGTTLPYRSWMFASLHAGGIERDGKDVGMSGEHMEMQTTEDDMQKTSAVAAGKAGAIRSSTDMS